MDQIFIVISVLAALAALVAAIWQWSSRRTLVAEKADIERQLREQQSRNEELMRDAARVPDLVQRISELEISSRQLQQALTAAAANEAALTARLADSDTRVRQSEQERAALTERSAAAARELNELSSRLATATSQRDSAFEARDQAKAFLDEAQSKLRTAFIEAASKVFDDKAAALEKKIGESAVSSQTGLEATLKPFATKLGEFQIELRKLGGDQAASLNTLVGSITQLQSLNQTMATSTDNLSRALKGNAKTRGDWGEMILDTVLKASGLEQGKNYEKQGSGRDDESGRLLRPDVTVNLPDGRQIVVDSKVNLVAWADANNADTPEAYQEALLRHTAALRLHVRDLAEKNYPKVLGANTLDLTVMFIPIEGALAAALAVNTELQAEAFQKKVVFASPNTLMAMLRVVERLWTRDKLQRQVGIIGDEAGKLLDALTSFITEFDDIEKKIDAAGNAYKTAKQRLSESGQSVYARARRLVEAGAKGKKQLPASLQPSEEITAIPIMASPADSA